MKLLQIGFVYADPRDVMVIDLSVPGPAIRRVLKDL